MATVRLEHLRKVYPYAERSEAKAQKKKAAQQSEERASNLQITSEGVVAVQDFTLDIQDKEFIVLIGPSGCGKSTTLRMIAGLETITEGNLYIDGRCVNDIAPKERDIAMVFQNYALYPHMTVYQNMGFALKLQRVHKKTIDEKVREAADILGIGELLTRKPKALSGGQRQRVAIGRAIVRDPKVFLMDEPLSNLDAKLRNQMRTELIQLHQRIQTTFVYVTHDQTEAMTLGDRIVVMKDGFVQQIGSPQEVFDHPANLFVAEFIGSPKMNILDANLLLNNGMYTLELGEKVFGIADHIQKSLFDKHVGPGPIKLGVRPDHVIVSDNIEGQPCIEATVTVLEHMGTSFHLHARFEDNEIVVIISTSGWLRQGKERLKAGDKVYLSFEDHVIHLFDAQTEHNLIK